ncbi:PLDc N-terminal domain-containing protein [Winogradskyella sp. A3E31]|uniref:PLDc N-terminal domain-containing protein n=1 Tax=Winogradskyella sp. A3E31 TaxID=3349637 RepID=UPI00398BB66E
MMINYLFIGPYHIIAFVVLSLISFITSFILISKNENGIKFLVWAALILFMPIVGPLCYLINHFLYKNQKKIA